MKKVINVNVSRGKMSKKAQKELDSRKRNLWQFSPVTRVKESKKVYSRRLENECKKREQEDND